MYATRIDLAEPTRRKVIDLLQARLSDALDLEMQLKQAHWNVKGRDFFQLHELFDKIHDEAEGFVDTLAERITALGGIADGRLATAASTSTLPPYPLEALGGADHLRAVATALAQFGRVVRSDIDCAAGQGDADSADVFTEISRETDKQLWFVEAHLASD